MSSTPDSTTRPPLRKAVCYDRALGDYAMMLDGELIGFARTPLEAERTLDELVFSLLQHQSDSAAPSDTPGSYANPIHLQHPAPVVHPHACGIMRPPPDLLYDTCVELTTHMLRCDDWEGAEAYAAAAAHATSPFTWEPHGN